MKNKKKTERFCKWMKMAFTHIERKLMEEQQHKISRNYTAGNKIPMSAGNKLKNEEEENKLGKIYFNNRYDGDKNVNNNSSKNKNSSKEDSFGSPIKKIIHQRRNSFNGLLPKESQLSDPNSSGICSLGCDLSKNSVEKGLRKYYNENKNHFLERVRKGPPETFRWVTWLIISGVHFDRNSSTYESIVDSELDFETDIQINKDITRTMKDGYYNCPEIQQMLFRVLKVLALVDKDLSYCQGMNFISGFLLIASDFQELETVYLLIALFSDNCIYGCRSFYTDGFPLLLFYIHVFNIHFAQKLPELFLHFKNIDLPDHCWISKWFQTLFTQSLTFEANLRVFDNLLIEGLYFLIPFSLSLLNFLKHELYLINDTIDITDYFKRLNATHYRLAENLQIRFDIEKILYDTKTRFWISKEEIFQAQVEFYKENKLEINYCKINIEEEAKKINLADFSMKQSVENVDNNTCSVNQAHSEIFNKSEISKNQISSTEATTNNLKNSTLKLSDLDSRELNIDFDDEYLTTDPGLARNKEILEHMDKNAIKFVNPFMPKLPVQETQNIEKNSLFRDK
jgi:hypothetical protein